MFNGTQVYAESSSTFITEIVDVSPPTVDAGTNRTVNEDTEVTFDASGSYDNVGIVNYAWTFIDVTPKTGPGRYVVTLTVKDPADNPDVDSITVTVLSIEPFPMWIQASIGVAVITITIAITNISLEKEKKTDMDSKTF